METHFDTKDYLDNRGYNYFAYHDSDSDDHNDHKHHPRADHHYAFDDAQGGNCPCFNNNDNNRGSDVCDRRNVRDR